MDKLWLWHGWFSTRITACHVRGPGSDAYCALEHFIMPRKMYEISDRENNTRNGGSCIIVVKHVMSLTIS